MPLSSVVIRPVRTLQRYGTITASLSHLRPACGIQKSLRWRNMCTSVTSSEDAPGSWSYSPDHHDASCREARRRWGDVECMQVTDEELYYRFTQEQQQELQRVHQKLKQRAGSTPLSPASIRDAGYTVKTMTERLKWWYKKTRTPQVSSRLIHMVQRNALSPSLSAHFGILEARVDFHGFVYFYLFHLFGVLRRLAMDREVGLLRDRVWLSMGRVMEYAFEESGFKGSGEYRYFLDIEERFFGLRSCLDSSFSDDNTLGRLAFHVHGLLYDKSTPTRLGGGARGEGPKDKSEDLALYIYDMITYLDTLDPDVFYRGQAVLPGWSTWKPPLDWRNELLTKSEREEAGITTL